MITLSLWFSGCKRNPTNRDTNMVVLERLSQNSAVSQDVRDRTQKAIANYTNSTIEPEPLLLYASPLIELSGSKRNELRITVIDEDNDLIGFGLKEESREADSAINILEEEYPLFVHYQGLATVNHYSIPFFTRTNEQRKDEEVWSDYLAMDFDAKMKQIKLPNKTGDWLSDMIEYYEEVYKLWEKTLPPVWISIPDPNTLNVWIYVYDKAGHKSNSLRLVRYTDPSDGRED
jgi:hypothetical protein